MFFCYPYRLHKRTRELGRSPSCKCPQQAQNPGPARRQAPGCATLHGMHTTESRICLLFYVDHRITPLPPNRSGAKRQSSARACPSSECSGRLGRPGATSGMSSIHWGTSVGGARPVRRGRPAGNTDRRRSISGKSTMCRPRVPTDHGQLLRRHAGADHVMEPDDGWYFDDLYDPLVYSEVFGCTPRV
jgi:hypothetical protein